MELNENKEIRNRWIKFVFQLALMLFILTSLVCLCFYFIGMQYYPICFPVIPVFYVLNGIAFYVIMSDVAKDNYKGASVKKIMIIRMARILGSVIVLGLGVLLDKEHIIPYVIVFGIYYFVYLFFETIVMTKLNKNNNKV